MLKRITVLFLLALAGLLAADEPLPAEAFLEAARQPRGSVDTYAMMNGEVLHRRSGGSTETVPVYLGIWFTADRSLGQLIIDDRQGYIISQAYRSGSDGGSVIPMGDYPDQLLDRFGLRASDLTLTFIYWPLVREMEPERVKTMTCRVMLLTSPETGEDDPAALPREWVKVYISTEYLYPVKAEWFSSIEAAENGTPERTLEVSGFRRQDDFWVVSELKLQGPGWRTLVKFDDIQVDKSEPGQPPPVIRSL